MAPTPPPVAPDSTLTWISPAPPVVALDSPAPPAAPHVKGLFPPRAPWFTPDNSTALPHVLPPCKRQHTIDWSDILDTYCPLIHGPKIPILCEDLSSPTSEALGPQSSDKSQQAVSLTDSTGSDSYSMQYDISFGIFLTAQKNSDLSDK